MALVPWSDAEKEAFLRMQFRAQSAHYAKSYPAGSFDIIMSGGQPAGRLITNRTADRLHVVDIALLPEFRGQGIGTYFLQSLIDEARAKGIKTTIYVEFVNPAQRLYFRLGFQKVEEQGVHWLLELSPRETGN